MSCQIWLSARYGFSAIFATEAFRYSKTLPAAELQGIEGYFPYRIGKTSLYVDTTLVYPSTLFISRAF
jgi:hypothetical protein